VTLTGGNRHDSTQLIPLVDAIPKLRGERGRPRQRPRWLYADRAYDSNHHRQALRDKGITPPIARKNTGHGSGLGKTRWVVERTFAWLHQVKRLRIRWDRRADIHLGLMHLAASSSATASCQPHYETSSYAERVARTHGTVDDRHRVALQGERCNQSE
jgi:transposase